MADVNEAVAAVTETAEKVGAEVKKATRKAKTTAKATAKTKAPVKRKPAAKRKPAGKKTVNQVEDFSNRAQEAGREAFLASLGFYGKAFDQVQEQFDSIQDRIEERRKKANKMYKELVKRGEKVEANAKGKLDDLELPKFELESLTDRDKLDAQLEKVKARFEDLKETVGLKNAA